MGIHSSLDGRFSRAYHILLKGVLSAFLMGCGDTPPPKESASLIDLLEARDWGAVSSFFKSTQALDEFPLKMALVEGAQWAGLRRIRRLDDHLIFEVDLLSTKELQSRSRYLFWVSTPQSQAHMKGEQSRAGLVLGWSPPVVVSRSEVSQLDLTVPLRFGLMSYRELTGHRETQNTARTVLGILGKEGGGASDSEWTIDFKFHHFEFNSLEKKKKNECKRPLNLWNKLSPMLLQSLRERCAPSLRFAAQRAMLNPQVATPQVVLGGEGGGSALRQAQDQALLARFDTSSPQDDPMKSVELGSNGVTFNGRVTLQQSLEWSGDTRIVPAVTEAIVIAPNLIQCLQSTTHEWSKSFLPTTPCEFKISYYFAAQQAEGTP